MLFFFVNLHISRNTMVPEPMRYPTVPVAAMTTTSAGKAANLRRPASRVGILLLEVEVAKQTL